MATGLVDKLHLAFEQVKKKKKKPWSSVFLAVHLSEFCQGAQHCCWWCCTDLSCFCRKCCKYKTPHGWAFWMSSPLPQNCFHFPTTPEGPERPMFHQHFSQAAQQILTAATAISHTVQGNGPSLFPFFFVLPESHAHQKCPWNCSLSYCPEGSMVLCSEAADMLGLSRKELSMAKKWSLEGRLGLPVN